MSGHSKGDIPRTGLRVLFVHHLALLCKKVVGKKKKTTSVTETRTNPLALQKVDPTRGVCVAIS